MAATREGVQGVPINRTWKIAREAGMTEGAFHHYSKDKAELVHAVVQQSMGDFCEVLENLMHTMLAAFDFQFRIVPIACSLCADHNLIDRTREIMCERNVGPECSVAVLARSFHKAMFDHFLAREVTPDSTQLQLRQTIEILMTGINPQPSDTTLVPLTGI